METYHKIKNHLSSQQYRKFIIPFFRQIKNSKKTLQQQHLCKIARTRMRNMKIQMFDPVVDVVVGLPSSL